ncbi:MFS transporter, partial [Streptomyces sp. NPDC055037]
PRGTVTEAFSWLVTTFGVGAALGTGAAGPAVEAGGTVAGFAVAGGGGFAALLVLLATQRVLKAPTAPSDATIRTENDRSGAAQPGFSSGHQA